MKALPPSIATYYNVVRVLGTGSFGQVVEAADSRTGVRVAIKLEERDAKYPQLLYEARILEQLGRRQGFPELYWFNTYLDWNVLVMPLLGKSLEADRVQRGGTLPMDVIMDVAQQGFDRLRLLHKCGWAYRDVKPENFVWHVERGKRVLYLIDFGLCKRVIYPGTSDHIPKKTGKTLTGTPRYASIRSHTGLEQSRRDDLESFVYMLVYLAKGELPWQRLPKKVHGAALSDDNFKRIGDCKVATPMSALCDGLPACFLETLTYARECRFEDLPDYEYIDTVWSPTQ